MIFRSVVMKAIKKLLNTHFNTGITEIDMKIVPRHEDWLSWQGDYADYDVIAIMYYQPTAPQPSVEALAAFVEQGGGHRCSSSPGWPVPDAGLSDVFVASTGVAAVVWSVGSGDSLFNASMSGSLPGASRCNRKYSR